MISPVSASPALPLATKGAAPAAAPQQPLDQLVRSAASLPALDGDKLRAQAAQQAAAPSQEPSAAATAPSQEPALSPSAPKKWTVLVYAAADNNLYPFELQNMLDLEKVGSTADFNVVTQFDGCEGAARRLMEKCESPDGGIASPVVKSLGAVNMSSPKTLASFIQWGMKHYPAEHTMLIINDHGGGWEGCVQDRSHGGWMTLPDLHKGLDMAQAKTGKKLDVLGFDACLMGMAEVSHELKDNADFMVGSQETEGVAGWPYSNILTTDLLKHMDAALTSRLPLEPKDVAIAGVQRSSEHQQDLPTMSAFDLSHEPELTASIQSLAGAIKASKLSESKLNKIVLSTESYAMNGFRDLYDLCDNIQASKKAEPELKAAAKACQDAVGKFVVAEQHGKKHPHSHGVSVETQLGNSGYDELDFAKDTIWQDAMSKFGSV